MDKLILRFQNCRFCFNTEFHLSSIGFATSNEEISPTQKINKQINKKCLLAVQYYWTLFFPA